MNTALNWTGPKDDLEPDREEVCQQQQTSYLEEHGTTSAEDNSLADDVTWDHGIFTPIILPDRENQKCCN